MIEFTSFEEVKPAESISLLLYGQAKTGKTDFSGSAGERSLYIDVGRSVETFHGASFRERHGSYKGFYVPIIENSGKKNYLVPDVAEAYDKVCDTIDEAVDKLAGKIDTIILDELTGLSRFAQNKALEINQGMGKSKAFDASKKWDMNIPGVQDYGGEMSLIKQFLAGTIDKLKANNIHFICIAHERWIFKTQEVNGKQVETQIVSKILPSFTGKKDIDTVPNLFDLVWHTNVARSGDKQVYRIDTEGTDILTAGSRYGGIFKPLETGLTFPLVIERIRNGIRPLGTVRSTR